MLKFFEHRYNKTQTAKYKAAADVYKAELKTHVGSFMHQFNDMLILSQLQPRTGEGQFWHKQKYPNQGWGDGMCRVYAPCLSVLLTWMIDRHIHGIHIEFFEDVPVLISIHRAMSSTRNTSSSSKPAISRHGTISHSNMF